MRSSAQPLRGCLANFRWRIAKGRHLFPFRTEQLSLSAPMVLGGQPPGRVGRRRFLISQPAPWTVAGCAARLAAPDGVVGRLAWRCHATPPAVTASLAPRAARSTPLHGTGRWYRRTRCRWYRRTLDPCCKSFPRHRGWKYCSAWVGVAGGWTRPRPDLSAGPRPACGLRPLWPASADRAAPVLEA